MHDLELSKGIGMGDIEKSKDDISRQSNSMIELADVRSVIDSRLPIYHGGVAAGIVLIIASFFAPSGLSTAFGVCAGIVVLLWGGVNMIAQKSLFARTSRLLASGCHVQAARVRFHKPPHTHGASLVGSLYFVDTDEHRFIAQAIGLHRLIGEQEVQFLEDENDPGFALMKTPNGAILLFLHPSRPGLPPTSEPQMLMK